MRSRAHRPGDVLPLQSYPLLEKTFLILYTEFPLELGVSPGMHNRLIGPIER